jgi:CubicO group peptidase (beta-lactamase class C family)
MRIRMIVVSAGAALLATGAAGAIMFNPGRAARVAAGLEAHSVCSAVFVQGVDGAAADRELVQLLTGPMGRLLSFEVDRAKPGVDAFFAGIVHARADFTPGYGCRLRHSGDAPPPVPEAPSPAAAADDFAPPQAVTAASPALAAAIDRVFAERPGEPAKQVKAVVVVKDGHVAAERYAPGFGIDTPLLSFSVAKSFTNAFLAILAREGRLRVDLPVGAPEWSRPDDPRAKITVEDLLRMRSGLDAPEDDSAASPVAQMEFLKSDMAAFAAAHPLKHPPGTEFEYTSSNTLILDRLVGDIVGGGARGLQAFAERELFAPLHMSNVTMEFDGSGTFVGSTWVYASARDFARFGQLYLTDGLDPAGRRLLPEGWVAWSRKSTLGASYGAGFWTNDGPSRFAANRVAGGFPKDGFYASGNLGQRIYIVPSERLVVVRFGYSHPPSFGIADDVALIKTAIAETRSDGVGLR